MRDPVPAPDPLMAWIAPPQPLPKRMLAGAWMRGGAGDSAVTLSDVAATVDTSAIPAASTHTAAVEAAPAAAEVRTCIQLCGNCANCFECRPVWDCVADDQATALSPLMGWRQQRKPLLGLMQLQQPHLRPH